MGFGIRALRKKELDQAKQSANIKIENLIYGKSLAATLLALDLEKKNRPFVWILASQISTEQLLADFDQDITCLTDQDLKSALHEFYPQLAIEAEMSPARFYKDNRFHEFFGRVKHFELGLGEEAFTQGHYRLNFSSLFTSEDKAHLEQILKTKAKQKILSEFYHLTENKDLVEPMHTGLAFSDNEIIECTNLYWANSPKEYFKKCQTKDEISSDLNNYISHLNQHSSLRVLFKLNQKKENALLNENKKNLLFLPQSMTHDWGHFLCQITDDQILIKSFFNAEESLSEEELAKKIKLKKRVFERIFEGISLSESTAIWFDSMGLATDIQELKNEIESNNPNHFFIDNAASLKPQYSNAIGAIRSLLALTKN
jgi:hypothetical protein